MIIIFKLMVFFVLVGLFEIGGGYMVWFSLREGKFWWIGVLGGFILIGYGVVAIWQLVNFGCVYVVYGGIFIVMVIIWGWKVDGVVFDKYDFIGGVVVLLGVLIIMYVFRLMQFNLIVDYELIKRYMAYNYIYKYQSGIKNIKIVFFINVGFIILEIIGGFFINSIVIIFDVLYDLGDSLLLGFVWYFESKVFKEGLINKFSFGYVCFWLLGVLVNVFVFIGGLIYIIIEVVVWF